MERRSGEFERTTAANMTTEEKETTTLSAPPPEAIRDEIDGLVRRELLGPFDGPLEEVEDNPTIRYLVGMLAAPAEESGAERNDDFASGGKESGEDGKAEPNTSRADSLFPSSMGFTFVVDETTDAVRLKVKWGRYEKRNSETRFSEKTGNPLKVWKRVPVEADVESLTIKPGAIPPKVLCPEYPGVVVQGLSRTRNGQRIVTLFLVNRQPKQDTNKDEAWLFQTEMCVESIDDSPVFKRRPTQRVREKLPPDQFEEDEEMAMLYRRVVEFAVGHGVAVHAETPPANPWEAVRIETRAIPTYEVEQQTASTPEDSGFEELAGVVLDMKQLAEADSKQLAKQLAPLANAYEQWIEGERAKVKLPSEHLDGYEEAVSRVTAKAAKALKRIKAGVKKLSDDEHAAAAFRFANRAMYLQRIHTKFSEATRRKLGTPLEEIEADPGNYTWRPFQLAFILLNLESLTDLHHKDRSHNHEAIADLLWFPTGGGKTEAYLGLAAYIMGLRRLQGVIEGRSGEKGLAVLMRYTLRLLTLQQFQRATALICACEKIRRDDTNKWGNEPFRIGLWVGQKSTPNTTEQSARANQRDRGNEDSFGTVGSLGSPAQLTNCPWCGRPIEPGADIEVESTKTARGRTLIYCSDALGNCLFSRRKSPKEGLPVVVVDEEIYRLLPTMMIATVDKFAQLPWNGRTQMLFGQVNGYCPRHGFRSPEVEDADSHPKRNELPAVKSVSHPLLRPPDLIIQDELHLISGPLGSLVGLYETVIDQFCTWKVNGKLVRPKIVASTATVRNAKNQVHRLFQRRVEVFPPPGTDAGNNFFSIRRPQSQLPGRRYIGICAPGRSQKATLIRVYTALLSATELVYGKYGKHVDPWMTLVGYFNSLRELAGMRRLVEDDVQNRLRHMDAHGLAKRKSPFIEELTSRKGSTDIPRVLDHMEAIFDPVLEKQRIQDRKDGKPPSSRRPIDVLLATNMISVGVDIGRLGLMVVGGQPKNTAEYIQATSRVGRTKPGLVCTVFNWARPRDLSHYERFEHYHATFYQQVESLSVTPFSARALDRGLTALLVALVRLAGVEFNPNETARDVKREHELVSRAIDTIVERIKRIEESNELGEEVRSGLKQRLDEWLTMAQRTPTLGYKGRRDGVTVPLLKAPEEAEWDTFTCLNSLRDVEASSSLILIDDAM